MNKVSSERRWQGRAAHKQMGTTVQTEKAGVKRKSDSVATSSSKRMLRRPSWLSTTTADKKKSSSSPPRSTSSTATAGKKNGSPRCSRSKAPTEKKNSPMSSQESIGRTSTSKDHLENWVSVLEREARLANTKIAYLEEEIHRMKENADMLILECRGRSLTEFVSTFKFNGV